MGIRGGQRARILQETMGIDRRSDTMPSLDDTDAYARPPTRPSVDSRVVEYVASVSKSNSSSPNSRTDAVTVPTSSAMTAAPRHWFLSDGICARIPYGPISPFDTSSY